MDILEFFRRSAGQWRSRRTTHHLPFRRAEMGESLIQVEPLDIQDSRIIQVCHLNDIDPKTTIGGASIRWYGAMEWDRETEKQEGSSTFAIVPDSNNQQEGHLLRERGYAEITPVVGRYCIDRDGALILLTEYETMSSVERFWFASTYLRLRTSTIKRFGGFSTASFCAETRISPPIPVPSLGNSSLDQVEIYSSLGW